MDTSLRVSSCPSCKNYRLAMAAGILGLSSLAVSLLGLLATLLLPLAFLVFCGLSLLVNLVALVLGIIGLVQFKILPRAKGQGHGDPGFVLGAVSLRGKSCLLPVLGTAILTLCWPHRRQRFLRDQQPDSWSHNSTFLCGRRASCRPFFDSAPSCQSRLLRVCLPPGVVRSRRASRSSTPVAGRVASRGGFDPHPLPPCVHNLQVKNGSSRN